MRTGDTWERVARDNQVAVNDLKAVNPKVQRLVSGSTLVIPARPGDNLNRKSPPRRNWSRKACPTL
ncbi:LysM peptidoglycan-binding domain-containing protein [Akkermansia muciniphila]|nr:LysM peptidoglycan-binding domain-containing protein [Akkermansia muciniphila]